MHTEDSHLERTPDLIAKIRALREQAEKEMNRFTDAADYDVRRVAGRKPRREADVQPVNAGKKRQVRKVEQASIDFSPAPPNTDGDEA